MEGDIYDLATANCEVGELVEVDASTYVQLHIGDRGWLKLRVAKDANLSFREITEAVRIFSNGKCYVAPLLVEFVMFYGPGMFDEDKRVVDVDCMTMQRPCDHDFFAPL